LAGRLTGHASVTGAWVHSGPRWLAGAIWAPFRASEGAIARRRLGASLRTAAQTINPGQCQRADRVHGRQSSYASHSRDDLFDSLIARACRRRTRSTGSACRSCREGTSSSAFWFGGAVQSSLVGHTLD
jgi:hypothetical protein